MTGAVIHKKAIRKQKAKENRRKWKEKSSARAENLISLFRPRFRLQLIFLCVGSGKGGKLPGKSLFAVSCNLSLRPELAALELCSWCSPESILIKVKKFQAEQS